jgi:hypothetical protein
MAYLLYSSLGDALRGGPFPHKAGEFCGNVFWQEVLPYEKGDSFLKNPVELFPHLRLGGKPIKFLIGRPKTPNKYDGQGIIQYGLYLTEDQPLPEDAVEIDTDMFLEEVVSGERLPEKPFDFSKIRRKELYY